MIYDQDFIESQSCKINKFNFKTVKKFYSFLVAQFAQIWKFTDYFLQAPSLTRHCCRIQFRIHHLYNMP